MDEQLFYDWLVIAWLALAVVTFFALFFVTAPYGRFTRGGWGPRISPRWGWVLMESPSLITFVVFYLLGDQRGNPLAVFFCCCGPSTTSTGRSSIPSVCAASGPGWPSR